MPGMAADPPPEPSPTSAAPLGATPLLVAAVIVHDVPARRVLLLQRGPHARFARGLWDLPSGKSDPGEPVTETAVRELHEETGLSADPGDLRLAHVIHGTYGVDAPGGYVSVVFALERWQGTARNREPAKHAQLCWTDLSALPEDFVPSTGRALRHHLDDPPAAPRVLLAGGGQDPPGD